ncbi:MAG: beta-lactamase family protein [Clostridiales bacterium]|nr:beta-lactamase family protein [Clostridiales bacterium]
MNREEFHRFIETSTGNESNILQICAIRDGKIVYDDCWYSFAPGDAMNVMSVTKGVMALLTGIAVTKGFIPDVDRPVISYFPEYTVKRGEKTIYDVTIRHLLTMTAPYKYRSEPWKKVCTSEDWTVAALDLLGGRSGITGEFKYATLGIQILTGILEKATGEKCIDFANRNLFRPLGIPDIVPHGDSSKEDQLNYVMSKLPRKHEWYCDPKHTVTAGWGLCLSATDMAKIGDLVLHGGRHGDEQILSEEYVKDMLTPKQKLGEMFAFMEYGYLWYKPNKDKEVYAAIGDCGNIIYVDMTEGISVGINGTFKPRIFDRVEFIETKVIPMIKNT